MARILDIVFSIFFIIQIPIIMLIDSQSVIPQKFVPKQLVDLRDWYTNTFRDVLIKETPLWMQTFVYCELLFQLPFCFVAAYGYFKGAEKCKWLRIPSIIYGSHVTTVMFSAITYIMFEDFSQAKHPAPRNMEERLTLAAVYAVYFIMLAAVVLDAVFSSAYSTSKKKNTNHSQNAPRQNVQKGRSRKKKAQ